jgi:hypothetical protein
MGRASLLTVSLLILGCNRLSKERQDVLSRAVMNACGQMQTREAYAECRAVTRRDLIRDWQEEDSLLRLRDAWQSMSDAQRDSVCADSPAGEWHQRACSSRAWWARSDSLWRAWTPAQRDSACTEGLSRGMWHDWCQNRNRSR